FIQAEDGIRDGHVTGVQTCALPIYHNGACGFAFSDGHAEIHKWKGSTIKKLSCWPTNPQINPQGSGSCNNYPAADSYIDLRWWRSEERRVGRECGDRWVALR